MLSAVSTRYAKALLDVVTEPGSNIDPQMAMDQMRLLAGMISTSPELTHALLSPAVSPSLWARRWPRLNWWQAAILPYRSMCIRRTR